MNSDKNIDFKLENTSKLISDNPMVYYYAKDLHSLNTQRQLIFSFCKSNMKIPGKYYLDYGVSNFLKNKKDLIKMLSSNSNVDVIIASDDRLTRDAVEKLKIKELCDSKNIKIFNVIENKLVFDDEPMLDFLKDNYNKKTECKELE